jgi:hypothetical protein
MLLAFRPKTVLAKLLFTVVVVAVVAVVVVVVVVAGVESSNAVLYVFLKSV